MSDKTNEEIYRAYLLGYACTGDASKVAVLQDARPLTSVIAAALALAERDRQASEPPDTWESLSGRLQAMFDEGEVVLQRRAEKRLTWKKHHHHFRRVSELFPVGLASELVHVLAHLPRVPVQSDCASFVIVRFLGVEKRFERSFRVDHDLLATR